MARDRQIFVRTTQEAYDWVVAQAEATGFSHGAVVSAVLELMQRSGAVLEGPQVALSGQTGDVKGRAVHAAGSHGNPEVAVDAAAGPTGPVAAGNDPGGSRPAPRERKARAKVTTAAELAKPVEQRQEVALPQVPDQPVPARYTCCKHCKDPHSRGHSDPCLNGCHG